MCMTEDQYVQKMMEWVSMRGKKNDSVAQVCAGRPRRTDNLTPANADVNDMGDKWGAFPLYIGCFSEQGKAGCEYE